MSRNLGFLPVNSLLIALIVILVVLGTVLIKGRTMFSPGPLNDQPGQISLGGILAHDDLAGRCDGCHSAPWSREAMSDRCLVCHTDVATQLLTTQELHGMFRPADGPLTCKGCHTEHRGPTASLTLEGLQSTGSFTTMANAGSIPLPVVIRDILSQVEFPLLGSEDVTQTPLQDDTPAQAPIAPAFIWTAIGISVVLVVGLIILMIELFSKAPRLAALVLVLVVTTLWLSFSGIIIARSALFL